MLTHPAPVGKHQIPVKWIKKCDAYLQFAMYDLLFIKLVIFAYFLNKFLLRERKNDDSPYPAGHVRGMCFLRPSKDKQRAPHFSDSGFIP